VHGDAELMIRRGLLIAEQLAEESDRKRQDATELSALEVMFRRLVNDAMRGDPKAMKLLLSLFDRYEESSETALQLRELLPEDRAILAQYLPRLADVESGSSTESDDGGLNNGGPGDGV
jgi:hypothetical protein